MLCNRTFIRAYTSAQRSNIFCILRDTGFIRRYTIAQCRIPFPVSVPATGGGLNRNWTSGRLSAKAPAADSPVPPTSCSPHTGGTVSVLCSAALCTPNNLVSAFLPSGLTVLPELLASGNSCGIMLRLLPSGKANEPKGITPFL